MSPSKIAEGIKSSAGLIFAAAAAIAAKMFPAALVPREIDYLENLGTLLAVVMILVAAVARYVGWKPSRRFIGSLLAMLGFTIIVVILVRMNFFECYPEMYKEEKLHCHLIGFQYSDEGRQMIENYRSTPGVGTVQSQSDLLFDLGLHNIPTIFGWSFTLLKNLYALAYLALLASLVLCLGIVRPPRLAGGQHRGTD